MKVYILAEADYEGDHTHGVYATLEAAQAADHGGHVGEWTEGKPGCQWAIRHAALQPEPVTRNFSSRKIPVENGVAVLPDGSSVLVPPGVEHVVVPEYNDVDPLIRFHVPAWSETCDYFIEEHEVRS